VAAIGSFKLKTLVESVELWLNWRLGGARRWKGETVGWEGHGVVCGKPVPSRL
jgi:hypothetical protein